MENTNQPLENMKQEPVRHIPKHVRDGVEKSSGRRLGRLPAVRHTHFKKGRPARPDQQEATEWTCRTEPQDGAASAEDLSPSVDYDLRLDHRLVQTDPG